MILLNHPFYGQLTLYLQTYPEIDDENNEDDAKSAQEEQEGSTTDDGGAESIQSKDLSVVARKRKKIPGKKFYIFMNCFKLCLC